ncbi:unnamed protein product, partial [Iphiclides podalirius]
MMKACLNGSSHCTTVSNASQLIDRVGRWPHSASRDNCIIPVQPGDRTKGAGASVVVPHGAGAKINRAAFKDRPSRVSRAQQLGDERRIQEHKGISRPERGNWLADRV